MKKRTEDLINEILEKPNIASYFNDNPEEFLDIPLHRYLRSLLAERNLNVSQVAERSSRGEYIYHVFRGIKNPGLDVVLSIALAMELTLPETDRLLRIARMPLLDARNRRDSILMFALNRRLTVPDTNDILYEFDEACL